VEVLSVKRGWVSGGVSTAISFVFWEKSSLDTILGGTGKEKIKIYKTSKSEIF